MLKLLFLTVTAALALTACSDRPVTGSIPGGPYADVNANMSEATLKAAHPEVICKRMGNPLVKMCHGKGSEGQDISFVLHSSELININGKLGISAKENFVKVG